MVSSHLGIDLYVLQEAFEDPYNELRKAYMRGLTAATIEIREEVMNLAHAGSPNSIQTAASWLSMANVKFE